MSAVKSNRVKICSTCKKEMKGVAWNRKECDACQGPCPGCKLYYGCECHIPARQRWSYRDKLLKNKCEICRRPCHYSAKRCSNCFRIKIMTCRVCGVNFKTMIGEPYSQVKLCHNNDCWRQDRMDAFLQMKQNKVELDLALLISELTRITKELK